MVTKYLSWGVEAFSEISNEFRSQNRKVEKLLNTPQEDLKNISCPPPPQIKMFSIQNYVPFICVVNSHYQM